MNKLLGVLTVLIGLNGFAHAGEGGVTSAGGDDKRARFQCVYSYEGALIASGLTSAEAGFGIRSYCGPFLSEVQKQCLAEAIDQGSNSDQAIDACITLN